MPPSSRQRPASPARRLPPKRWSTIGALMRDVPFTGYSTSSLAAQACADLNNMSYIRSQQNIEYPYPITPGNLFRGQIVPGDGNLQGPFVSQFMMQPTFFGVQPLTQQCQRYLSVSQGGGDFMTSPSEYLAVQNGAVPNARLAFDPSYCFVRMGRDLAAYTRVDVLYQAYQVAFLVLAGIGAPANPGNPYRGSQTEHGFGTL